MTNGYAESSTHEEGTNAFSALDDAVAGFTSNDDTQSHVAPSLNESRPSSVAPNAHAPPQLTNGIMNEDSDTDSDVNRNRDESSNISDIESDVQRNSNALENGDIDSDDSGSGRKVSSYRPSTPKPGGKKSSEIVKRDSSGSHYRDSVIDKEDPALNQTMVF